jgi:hypothetical protein
VVDRVPDVLLGAWRRTSIVNDDGSSDTDSIVLWLQLESAMVDVRIPVDTEDPSACEASTGHTTCSPFETGGDGIRRAIAEWHTRGPDDIAIHPVSAFPEPGLLAWNEDGSVMIERAPSGAYVEEWHRVPGSTDRLIEHRIDSRHRLYVAGDLAVMATDDRGDDRSPFDVEFAICEPAADGSGWRIMASTLPGRRGEGIDVGFR